MKKYGCWIVKCFILAGLLLNTSSELYGLSVNDRVSVVNGPKNIRSTPSSSSSSNIVGEKSNGALGTIIGGPTLGTGYTWYNVNFDSNPDGWIIEGGLALVTSVPGTPSGTSPGTTSSPGPTLSSKTVTLSWGSVSGATYYDVGVTDMATGSLVVNDTTSSTSYTTTLTAGKQYRWNVAAGNSAGLSSYTTRLYFQTPSVTYTVSYNANGATSGTVPAAQTKTQGVALTLASNSGSLAKTGYTFAGWNTASNGSGTDYAAGGSYTANASVTLYAKWTAPDVTAPTINSPGDTTSPGSTLSTLTPQFTWTAVTGASGYGLYIRNVTDNILVYPNSSGTTTTPLTGTSFNLPSGYLVNGKSYRWAMTSFSGSTETAQSPYRYFQTPSVTYTVSYNANGATSGTVPAAQTKTHGVALTLASNSGNLAKTGYTFAGWNTAANGSGTSYAVAASYTANAAVTLYAKWTQVSALSFRFPLAGYTPYTAPASSVFDHSGARYIANSEVVAYTGEKGTVRDDTEGAVLETLYSYKKPDGTAFVCNGNYRGTVLTGSSTLNYDGHPGWDYAVVIGTPVYAVADGVVTQVTTEAGSGKYIRLQHGTDYQSQYLHLDEQLVALNANVTKGQLIGKSGNSGGVAPHLHFEVKKLVSGSWVSVDPYGWTGTGADPYQIANTRLWEDGAPVTYAVTYNANGATSGTAPGSQTKTQGVTLTLASNSGNLAKTGYSFAGWNTAANGSGTDYAAGGSYTANAVVTLYAKWTTQPTYTVSYNANGATSGAVPAAQTKTHGVTLTLASNSGSLAKTGYTFAGWNTASNGSGTDYAAGGSYTANASVTLYAKWTTSGGGNVMLPGAMTYIRQINNSDMHPNFNSSAACGPASAVMILTYFNKLAAHPMVGKSGQSNNHSWYVAPIDQYGNPSSSAYSSVNFSFNTGVPDPAGQINYGAHGFLIENINVGTVANRAVQYFWKHGMLASFDDAPTEPKVKSEIDAGRPVFLSTRIFEGGKTNDHIMVIRGYNSTQLIASDPWVRSDLSNRDSYAYTWNNLHYGGDDKWMIKAFSPITAGITVRGTAEFNVRVDPNTASSTAGPTRSVGATGTILLDSLKNSTFWNADGYTWVKVRWDSDQVVGWSVVGTGDIPYIEPFGSSQSTYTVTYNPNGATSGSAPATQIKTHGVALTLASSGNLVKSGYTFVGWNTLANGSGTDYPAGASYTANAALALYAKWTPVTYAVTYNANGATSGTVPGSQTKTHGVSLTLASNSGNLAKTGYSFAGWNTLANGAGTDYAVGGSYTANATVTLYAKWTTVPTYAVTYNANGATSGTAPASQTKTQGVTLTLASNSGNLAKTGYSFAGWNTAANGSGTTYAAGASYTANAPLTLFAKWTPVTYAVTYAVNGATSGTAPVTQTKTHDVTLTLASNSGNLAKSGYTFAGWNTAANGSGTTYAAGASYTANAPLALFAKWTPVTYAVTYAANGASSGTVPGSQTKTHGVTLTLASNSGSLVKTGYTFAGWNTAANGLGTTYAAGASYTANAAVTLYAKWQTNVDGSVYRFWSDSLMSHFFTASAAERDQIIATSSGVWKYEGVAFYVHGQAVNGSSPVHRFWSDRIGCHMFTISDEEKATLQTRYAKVFTYEGAAWHAFDYQAPGTLPVYRFWAPTLKKPFFTISEAEKNNLIADVSGTWSYQGIAWYAYASATANAPASLVTQSKANTESMSSSFISDVAQAAELPVAVTFGLSYGPDAVVSAMVHDPVANTLTEVLEPTVSPRELVIPALPFGQRYWLSVMSHHLDSEQESLDYGGWLGRVPEVPAEEFATVAGTMAIGLPVEHIVLPETDEPLALRLYSDNSLIRTVTGLKGGATYELGVPAWNQWYRLEIVREQDGEVLESQWVGHMRTH